jgi:Domain of unknown function (DUF4331)
VRDVRSILAATMTILLALPTGGFAASHREAPLTALDHAADITDFFAFRSYDDPTKVTFILNVDPLLEPANGPNYFPFDPSIVYAIHIDNSYDAIEDISFEFRFTTTIRAPGVFTGFVGVGSGVMAPANAPHAIPAANGTYAVPAGQPVIPPAITALDGAGAAGLSLQQTYTVTMVQGSGATATRTDLTNGMKLIAVPSNVGPRTMPNYPALAKQGIFNLGSGVTVFAGTVDDPFYIDLGAAFDTFNFRPNNFFAGATSASGGVLPILSQTQDGNDSINYGVDMVSGYNVNSIAIQVPISMVTQNGKPVIGTWGTTSRLRMTVRPANPGASAPQPTDFVQVQRMGNPLINELIIGTGSKDTWSMTPPSQDAQFAPFALDPLLARVLNAAYGLAVPDPPRADLLPLVQYSGPFAGPGSSPGPVADLLRLDTSVPPTPMASRRRLGLLAGDNAGFPNGRRVSDDVTDVALRVVAGVLCSASCTSSGIPFSAATVPLLGDGVNTNDVPYQESFPYVGWAHSGRDRRHVDPTEVGCTPNCP